MYTKNIGIHSQPAGLNKGSVIIATTWSPAAHKLEIKVGRVGNLKGEEEETCSGSRDFYMKVITYVGPLKHKSFKSQPIKPIAPSQELPFDEKFVVQLDGTELKDSSTVFLLFSRSTNKMVKNKLLCGRTIVGPYMRRTDGRCLSQWESNIANPLEEIVETHELFL